LPYTGISSGMLEKIFVPLDADQMDQDFVAIRLGDPTGSWTAQNGLKSSHTPAMTQITGDKGNVTSIAIVADQNHRLQGIDLALSFDGEVLDNLSVSLDDKLNQAGYALLLNKEKGHSDVLIYANQQFVDLAIGDTLALIHLKKVSDRPGMLTIERFDINEKAATVELKNAGKIQSMSIHTWPNPFTEQLNISYFLPMAGEVELTMYDHSGRMVRNIYKENQHAGTQLQAISTTDLANGMYTLRLITGDEMQQFRLIKVWQED